MLEIQSNGSKWFGQKPDTIEELIEVLNTYALDPTFEDCGNFYNPNPQYLKKEYAEKYKGCSSFFGNFAEISHVFNITTDEPEIIRRLVEAINNNKSTSKYQEVRREYIEKKQRKENARNLFNQGKINQKEMYQMMAGVI